MCGRLKRVLTKATFDDIWWFLRLSTELTNPVRGILDHFFVLFRNFVSFGLIWLVFNRTRLHPQGKGGPEATFCVRRTKSSQIHVWRILMCISNLKQNPTNYYFATNLLISGRSSVTESGRTPDGRTDGRRPVRTHEHRFFLALPTQKAPSGQ